MNVTMQLIKLLEQQNQYFELALQKGPKAPTSMYRGSSTLIDNIAYFNPWHSQNVYAFDSSDKKWSTLLKCPYRDSTLTSINNKLVAVGGRDPNYPYPQTNVLL